MSPQKILAIIPAFNEEKNIGSIVTKLKGLMFDVLVVDDCSSDNTARIASCSGANVIRLPFNLGYGGALQTGFLYARGKNYEVIVHLDGDGQHDPEDAVSLIDPIKLGEADVVFGSRYLREKTYAVPVFRRIGQIIFGGIASFLTGFCISDPTTGYQALSREVVDIYCSSLYPCDYPDANMFILLNRLGFTIKEVPVRMKQGQKSMHSGFFRPLYYIFKMCLSIFVALVVKLPSRR